MFKGHVSDRQGFVDDDNLRIYMYGNREREPDKHTARISFDRLVDKLANVRKGGIVVCGGIHMSPIPEFPYDLLWGERRLASVANLTRRDGVEFLRLAAQIPIESQIQCFSLAEANEALEALRAGRITGSAVLDIAAGVDARD